MSTDTRLNPADFAEVAAQLGRPPRSRCAVAWRCPAGHIAVIENVPGPNDPPFPTLYWLTCPTLSRTIATLERDGVIADLQARLNADENLQASLRNDHADYITRRGNLPYLGIAGMTNFAAVKCLHAHYAHHLASHNTLGAILRDEYGITPCR